MNNITIEVITDGNIELCRELCDELMAFQKSAATIAPETFDEMNFDTRMKKSYESALASQVIVVKDNGVPVGYVFSTIEDIEHSKNAIPAWAPADDLETCLGFYPDWDDLPNKVGLLNNLYLRDGYRDMGLGSKLFKMAMEWLESFSDVELVFIFVSNGNGAALDFYISRGFTFSHDVFGGFIQAVYKWKGNRNMSVKINQMLSLRIEQLLANGFAKQDILAQLKEGTFQREQLIGEGTVDFSLLIEFAENHWEQCRQAILNGYQVTFHTVNGVKSLLAVKFGLQAGRDYQDGEEHLDGIPLTAKDAEWLKSVLAMNWQLIEEGNAFQIRLTQQ